MTSVTKYLRMKEYRFNKSFIVRFSFRPNNFFEETELTIKYNVDEDDEVVSKEGSTITWKDEKTNPTVKQVKVSKKVKGQKNPHIQIKTKRAESFFNFFLSDKTVLNENDEMNQIQLTEEAEFFRDSLIPDCMELYLGINEDHHDHPEDFDDEDSEGSESSQDKKQRKKSGASGKNRKKSGADNAGNPQGGDKPNPECKNQ